jgi:hypothetical protein
MWFSTAYMGKWVMGELCIYVCVYSYETAKCTLILTSVHVLLIQYSNYDDNSVFTVHM